MATLLDLDSSPFPSDAPSCRAVTAAFTHRLTLIDELGNADAILIGAPM